MHDRWPVWKLALLLYVFVTAAVAINLFMLALMFRAYDLPPLPPSLALLAAVPLGVPAALLAGRWVRSLLDQAR